MASVPKMSAQHIAALKRSRDELDDKLRQALEAVNLLRGEIAGIDRALAVMQGVEPMATVSTPPDRTLASDRRPRGAVKDVVIGLVVENAADGLKTTDVVDLARSKGVNLDRNSVASLLSRLTKEGVTVYDEGTRRYRPSLPNVTPLRNVI